MREAKAAAAARMENSGQACNASKRMIVTDDVYDEFISEFTAAMSGYVTGDPTDPATARGRRPGTALRRDEALGRRPGARTSAHRRVREQETHPHHARRRVGGRPGPILRPPACAVSAAWLRHVASMAVPAW